MTRSIPHRLPLIALACGAVLAFASLAAPAHARPEEDPDKTIFNPPPPVSAEQVVAGAGDCRPRDPDPDADPKGKPWGIRWERPVIG